MKTNYDGIGIYALIDNEGKMYIGSSTNVKRRITYHKIAMKRGSCNKQMLEAIKNGKTFHCEILEKIEYGNNRFYIFGREKYYIDKYDTLKNGYNIAPTTCCSKEELLECRKIWFNKHGAEYHMVQYIDGLIRKNEEPVYKEEYEYFTVSFDYDTDADIIEWLEKQPNKQTYIKNLIKEELKKN